MVGRSAKICLGEQVGRSCDSLHCVVKSRAEFCRTVKGTRPTHEKDDRSLLIAIFISLTNI